MKRIASSALLASVVCACSTPDRAAPDGPLPYVAILKPSPDGEEDIFLTAGLRSRIRIDGECVLIGDARYGLTLPIFCRGTIVGRDARGLYLQDAENGIRFRDGDTVRGGGGHSPFTGREIDASLREPVPEACLARTNGIAGSVNPGLRRD